MDTNNQIQIVESWMKDVSVELGVELSLDSDGVCTFQIDHETIIAIEVSQDLPMVYIYSPLMAIPEDKDAATALLIRALELNAFQAATRGGALAIAPGANLLIFCYSMPIEGSNSGDFSIILGGFFKTLPELKSLLTQTDVIESPLSSHTVPKNFIKI